MGSVKETRAVNESAEGVRGPGGEVQRRLRRALQVALAIADADGAEVTRAWFQGPNEIGPAVIAAERAFVVGG